MKKLYVNAQSYLQDTWRLGRRVIDSGWRPDVLLALWRGGAPVGVALHEYLKVNGESVRHLPVKCSSYDGIGTEARQEQVIFECAEEVLDSLKAGDRVLVVDDVFDSGRTAAAVKKLLTAHGCESRIACVYFKPANNLTTIEPDYYVEKTDAWLVFPHEIEGLTKEELAEKDAVLAELMK